MESCSKLCSTASNNGKLQFWNFSAFLYYWYLVLYDNVRSSNSDQQFDNLAVLQIFTLHCAFAHVFCRSYHSIQNIVYLLCDGLKHVFDVTTMADNVVPGESIVPSWYYQLNQLPVALRVYRKWHSLEMLSFSSWALGCWSITTAARLSDCHAIWGASSEGEPLSTLSHGRSLRHIAEVLAEVLASCSRSLYAIRILKCHGVPPLSLKPLLSLDSFT